MPIFGNALLKEIPIQDEPFNIRTKLAYWVKELYRFSESELKDHFGKRYKDLINENLIQKSPHDQYYYCHPEILKSIGDGNFDNAVFYSSLTAAQLKQLAPKEAQQGSKNDIITRLVRSHLTIFPELKNLSAHKIPEILSVLSRLRAITSQYDPNIPYGQPFRFYHPHDFYRKSIFTSSADDMYKDITSTYPELFHTGYIHCLINRNPLSCCIVLNPNICSKIISETKTKVAAKKKHLIEELPEIKVNPSDIEYHESKLNLSRIVALFIAGIKNEEIGFTQERSLKVSDVKSFWKTVLGASLADNQIQYYSQIMEIFISEKIHREFEKLSFKERIDLQNKISITATEQFNETFSQLPKDKWISIDNIINLVPCSEIHSNRRTLLCNVDDYIETGSQKYEEGIIFYLIIRRMLTGDVDLEVGTTKNKKNKTEKIIKSVRILSEQELANTLIENDSANVFLENNLSLTLPPDLPFKRLLELLNVFSPVCLNSLQLDKSSIFRLTNQNMNFKMAYDYISSLLDRPIPKSALDFLQKELPSELSTITLFPYHRVISLSSTKDLPKVLEAVGKDKMSVINEHVILLTPWTTLGSLKNKFKNRKIRLEVNEIPNDNFEVDDY